MVQLVSLWFLETVPQATLGMELDALPVLHPHVLQDQLWLMETVSAQPLFPAHQEPGMDLPVFLLLQEPVQLEPLPVELLVLD